MRVAKTQYEVDSGARWDCPPWAIVPTARITVRTCRSCGARIAWLKTIKTGSLTPVEASGESHFARCPDSPSWRKPKAGREEAAL
jgi:hypothetical protein